MAKGSRSACAVAGTRSISCRDRDFDILLHAASGYSCPMALLAEVFSPGGSLSARLPGYTYREAQQQMAELVRQAIDDGRHAALEAGTGIGKTYAYLVPVLLSGRRVIISTGTRTLQDQLFSRDLPSLGAVLGRPVEVGAAKGPEQLPVLAAVRNSASGRPQHVVGWHARDAVGLGPVERERRPGRARRAGWRARAARPDHVDRRQLPRQPMRVPWTGASSSMRGARRWLPRSSS